METKECTQLSRIFRAVIHDLYSHIPLNFLISCPFCFVELLATWFKTLIRNHFKNALPLKKTSANIFYKQHCIYKDDGFLSNYLLISSVFLVPLDLCLLVEVLGGSEPLTPIMPSSVSWCQSNYLDALFFLTRPLPPLSSRIQKKYIKSKYFFPVFNERIYINYKTILKGYWFEKFVNGKTMLTD